MCSLSDCDLAEVQNMMVHNVNILYTILREVKDSYYVEGPTLTEHVACEIKESYSGRKSRRPFGERPSE